MSSAALVGGAVKLVIKEVIDFEELNNPVLESTIFLN